MQSNTEKNKQIVVRFNKEFIEDGKIESFWELVSKDVCNHSAPEGRSKGPEGMIDFLQNVLKAGFPDLKVEIYDQIAEGDKVVTRKAFQATHTGEIMGIPPSNKKVTIKVTDIIRLKDGKYIEHWGSSNFFEVMQEVAKK